MYIFQPDRYLLDAQIGNIGHYITGKVLDVGAGEVSRYENYFEFEEYLRMDIHHGEQVDVVGSADAIPFPDSSFDSIVCTQVFEHLSRVENSVKEIHRVLKSKGHLLVTVPQVNELHEEPHDYFRYTKYGLISLFESSGFRVLEINQRGGFFSTVAQIKIRYLIDRFDLYKRPYLGRIFSFLCKLYGRSAIFLDSKDVSLANRKHTIGWCAIFQKD